MEKGKYLLVFLIISTAGYSQNDRASNKIKPKIATSRNTYTSTFCDNEIEAHFPGGFKSWTNYVTRNFKMEVAIKNKAPEGTYHVKVTFLITKDGKISNIKAKTSFGYGIEQEVIRAIKHCPKRIPDTYCEKKINSYKTQPITITIF